MALRRRSPSKPEYIAIAAFRRQLRHFLAFSEAAAAKVGLPPQQHQALLAIAGWEEGKPTVGALAEHLLIAPHTAAELIQRMAAGGLLTKSPSASDRRKMQLTVTAKAAVLLRHLTAAHLEELRTLEPALVGALGRLGRVSEDAGRKEGL